MPPRGSIILVDTVAIKGAHDLGCWNSLRKAYELHSVKKCVEEATRPNKHGARLVERHEDELAAELKLGSANPTEEGEQKGSEQNGTRACHALCAKIWVTVLSMRQTKASQ